ncbi:MAG: 2Fe-2S iron-sulfur cluster binding domain-containing protein [Clostridiales bacterium]|jgi:NADP-reducing hydrogenase subunit HndD|nr:2Fe-2S iron-sulfur cluster binding domain-containing protein [Clostridiales bacterium]
MADIRVTIDNIEVTVPDGSTLLEAARAAGIDVPTLCYLKDCNAIAACRICVCEVVGARSLVAACVFPCKDGMVAYTNTEKIKDYRRKTLQLILSDHNQDCLGCSRSGHCELQNLCQRYGVENTGYYSGEKNSFDIDESSASIVRDNNKCILCRRCVGACENLQGIGVIGANERGFDTYVGSAFNLPLAETSCVNCGQCIVACPTGALHEKDSTADVKAAIADPDKVVIVQPAPSVRVGLGECFGMPVGTEVEGKIAAALKRLGFDKAFDTNFAADLTIIEEGYEFINRVKNGGTLPLITSCSPGWVKYCEHYYPDMIPNLSTCKSPQQMFGAVLKSYYAEKFNIPLEKLVSVSIMPCTAKKFEVGREDQSANEYPDVDYALTTRELGKMITEAGIDFANLPDEEFDNPLGEYTGAGVIFGATGGVMEAALRTAVEVITGEELIDLDFKDVRGVEGIKEASYNVEPIGEVRVAVASGLANARKLLDMVKSGEKSYHFIEIMACPGGCVNGGGQPHVPAKVRNNIDVRSERAKGLYTLDKNKAIRKSHENPMIVKLYEEYLGEPNGEKAHHLLHTSYVERLINKDHE